MRFRTGVFFLSIAFVLSHSAAAETATLQWQDPTPEKPWLSRVEVAAFDENIDIRTSPAEGGPEYPHGLRVEFEVRDGETGWLQLRLAGGYGFLVSDRMLREHAYVWVRDMGIYISLRGTWEETAGLRQANARLVQERLEMPFVSCAEKYFQWTGWVEHDPRLDQKIWEFVDAKQNWPIDALSVEHIAKLPEVDSGYFQERFPDLKYSRIYLGWPDHNDEFILWDNGKIGVSSRSVGGDPEEFPDVPWQPRARGYTFQFGVGDAPRFREYGDSSVAQSLLDGYQLVVATDWEEIGLSVHQTNFAYPLQGEEVKTGVEPLLAWTELELENSEDREVSTYLGIEFTNEDFFFHGRKTARMPLPDIEALTWRRGGFYLLGELVLVGDPKLEFEEIPTPQGRRRFRALISLGVGETGQFHFAALYRPSSPALRASIDSLGYRTAYDRTVQFWDELEKHGATIQVPDPLFNNLYRTFLPRLTINSDLDLEGRSVLQTGPIVYNLVWHHVTSYGVADYLSRMGQFELAKRYLDPYFDWQGIPAPDSPAITNWEGFFGAPKEQCPLVWLMYQGMIQWASARYFQLSDDREWLDRKLPALIKSMEWVRDIRKETMKLNPDGSRPLNYGWFPPGRVTDGSHGTSIFSDANIWRGMEYLTRVLEQIDHSRAAEFRAETDDYRACLQDGLRRAASERPLVRLNDDSWVPYLPAYLERRPGQIETTRWYAAVVDGPWQGGMLDTRVFPSGSPENWWLVNFFEDTYSPMNPGLPDEPFWACHATEYLARDRVENFLYTLFSQSTTTLARETLTTYEHRSWGKDRVFELTGWAAGYWFRNFSDMLARTVDDELWLNQATPRTWLEDGKEIRVEGLQTEFGPLSYSVISHLNSGTVRAQLSVPTRRLPDWIRMRFRAPNGLRIRGVTLNGGEWHEFDSETEWVKIPGSLRDAEIIVRF